MLPNPKICPKVVGKSLVVRRVVFWCEMDKAPLRNSASEWRCFHFCAVFWGTGFPGSFGISPVQSCEMFKYEISQLLVWRIWLKSFRGVSAEKVGSQSNELQMRVIWQVARRSLPKRCRLQGRQMVTVHCQESNESKLKFFLERENAVLARTQGPLALFDALIKKGQLQDDCEQRRVMEILNAIYFGAPKRTSKGLYLYGSVGCGKTMSMDLFFFALKNHPSLRVQRKHFHEFLYDIQRLLHQIKAEDGAVSTGLGVQRAGERMADAVDVLCFDEFAVTTIQDCCILMPLFNALFMRGVTIIATSNRAPDELYSDGLNRQVYLPPFLELLQNNCKVLHMQNKTDYRAMQFENSPDAGVFCWPPETAFVDSWFQRIAAPAPSAGEVEVAYSRRLAVPYISNCGGVARFTFSDLCEQHLAADDYNAICSQFHSILIDEIPKLTVDQHNEARRLTLLIDCCYEHHVRLIASMDGPPEEILGGLTKLQDISMSSLKGEAGCGDSDSASSSSGVLSAIQRIKTSLRSDAGDAATLLSGEGMRTDTVLESEIQRAKSHGGDINIWRQDGQNEGSLPQVSKGWDDRRRISQFTWESTDPTSESQSIKGVFVAAVASLKESGFAVDRAISRLREMQTVAFQDAHRAKHGLWRLAHVQHSIYCHIHSVYISNVGQEICS